MGSIKKRRQMEADILDQMEEEEYGKEEKKKKMKNGMRKMKRVNRKVKPWVKFALTKYD